MNKHELVKNWEQSGLLSRFEDKKESIAGCLQAQCVFNESKDDLPVIFRRISVPLVIRVFSESNAFKRNNFTLAYKEEGEPKTLMFHTKYTPFYEGKQNLNIDEEADFVAEVAKSMVIELDEAFGDSKNMDVEFLGFGCLNNGTLLMYYK